MTRETRVPLSAFVRDRIKTERSCRGWSQADLAARTGVSQAAISYWENGRRDPGLDDLEAVARAFDVPVARLLADGALSDGSAVGVSPMERAALDAVEKSGWGEVTAPAAVVVAVEGVAEYLGQSVDRGAEAISDLLTMLGVNPDERPEHGGQTTAETLAAAVLRSGQADTPASENARLREALDLLRPAHHTPYADPEHQGGNCVDWVMVLLARAHKADMAVQRVREWCDKTEADTTAWLAEHNPACECEVGQTRLEDVAAVRALLPEVPPAAEEDDVADDRDL